MAVIGKTELGEIKISDDIIANIISDVLNSPEICDKIWPATVHGHKIGRKSKIAEIVDLGDSDLVSNISVSTDDQGDVTIEFSVIVRFGISIKSSTKMLSDQIAENMQYILGVKPSIIIINIAGVKSRQIAKRNTRTIYRYEQ